MSGADRVVVHDGSGAPRVATRAPEEPRSGEVRYRVEAFALNHAELLYLRGAHYVPTRIARRLGYEACGRIDAVGPGVNAFAVGDRVASLPFASDDYGVNGSWAITPAEWLVPVAEDVLAIEACSGWMQYLTAYYPLVELTPLGPGDALVVTAASSSAALGAMQIARDRGVRVIGLSRGRAKHAALIAAGYDAVIDLAAPDLADAILATTAGRPIGALYDAVGGNTPRRVAAALAPGATIYAYGMLSGDEDIRMPLLAGVRGNLRLHAYATPSFSHEPAARARAIAYIAPRLADGRLRPVIDRVFGFDEIDTAYRHLGGGSQIGKVVVKID